MCPSPEIGPPNENAAEQAVEAEAQAIPPPESEEILLDFGVCRLLGDEFTEFARSYTWETVIDPESPAGLRFEAAMRMRGILAETEVEALMNRLKVGGVEDRIAAALCLSAHKEFPALRSLHAYMLRLSRNVVDDAEVADSGRAKLTELMRHPDPTAATIAALNLRHYGSPVEKTAALDQLLMLICAGGTSPHLRNVLAKAVSSHWSEETSLPLQRQMVFLDLTGRSMPATWRISRLEQSDDSYRMQSSLAFSPLHLIASGYSNPEMIDLRHRTAELRFPVVVIAHRIGLADAHAAGAGPGRDLAQAPLLVLQRAPNGPEIKTFPLELHARGASVAFYLEPPVYCTMSLEAKGARNGASDEVRAYGYTLGRQESVCLRLWRG